MTGGKFSNIEDLSPNRVRWFKDRPETIAHNVIVDALK